MQNSLKLVVIMWLSNTFFFLSVWIQKKKVLRILIHCRGNLKLKLTDTVLYLIFIWEKSNHLCACLSACVRACALFILNILHSNWCGQFVFVFFANNKLTFFIYKVASESPWQSVVFASFPSNPKCILTWIKDCPSDKSWNVSWSATKFGLETFYQRNRVLQACIINIAYDVHRISPVFAAHNSLSFQLPALWDCWERDSC